MERINKNDDSYYLIFVEEDDGTLHEFKNADSILRGKFNSSRVYNELKEGKKYEFVVVGYRIDFLSLYENIIKFKEIK